MNKLKWYCFGVTLNSHQHRLFNFRDKMLGNPVACGTTLQNMHLFVVICIWMHIPSYLSMRGREMHIYKAHSKSARKQIFHKHQVKKGITKKHVIRADMVYGLSTDIHPNLQWYESCMHINMAHRDRHNRLALHFVPQFGLWMEAICSATQICVYILGRCIICVWCCFGTMVNSECVNSLKTLVDIWKLIKCGSIVVFLFPLPSKLIHEKNQFSFFNIFACVIHLKS